MRNTADRRSSYDGAILDFDESNRQTITTPRTFGWRLLTVLGSAPVTFRTSNANTRCAR